MSKHRDDMISTTAPDGDPEVFTSGACRMIRPERVRFGSRPGSQAEGPGTKDKHSAARAAVSLGGGQAGAGFTGVDRCAHRVSPPLTIRCSRFTGREIIKSGREICGSKKKTLRFRRFASISALRTGATTKNDQPGCTIQNLTLRCG